MSTGYSPATSASPASASPASSSALRAQPTRRRFLTSTATAAAITAVGIVAGQAGSRPTANAQSSDGPLGSSGTAPNDPAIANLPTLTEDHQVIVIGSGFGGGVSALRLAGAGVEVTVLERGRRWETGPNATTFPSPTKPDKRMLWHRSATQLFGRNIAVDPFVGIIEAVSSPTMTALCPTGIGGGSLVYQGMSLQPSKEVFMRRSLPGSTGTTWTASTTRGSPTPSVSRSAPTTSSTTSTTRSPGSSPSAAGTPG